MKKALLITLALVALVAFVSCSAITPVGNYVADDEVEILGSKVKVSGTLSLNKDNTVDVTLKFGDISIPTPAGKWTKDGDKVSINGIDAKYNGTSLVYSVDYGKDTYSIKFKRK